MKDKIKVGDSRPTFLQLCQKFYEKRYEILKRKLCEILGVKVETKSNNEKK